MVASADLTGLAGPSQPLLAAAFLGRCCNLTVGVVLGGAGPCSTRAALVAISALPMVASGGRTSARA